MEGFFVCLRLGEVVCFRLGVVFAEGVVCFR